MIAKNEFDRLPSPDADDTAIAIYDAENWVKVIFAEVQPSGRLDSFTHKDVQEITKISKSQLNHLVQTGTIIPYDKQSGRGGRSSYSYQNLLEIMLCRELKRFSISIEDIKDVTSWIRDKKWCFPFNFRLDSKISMDSVLKIRRSPSKIEEFTMLEWEKAKQLLIKKWRDGNRSADYSDIQWGIKDTEEFENHILDLVLECKIPPGLNRVHTIWEYLGYYPLQQSDFFLVLSHSFMEASGGLEVCRNVWIREAIELYKHVSAAMSAITVSFYRLKEEADFEISKRFGEAENNE